jgi:hypothetical protein
MGKYLVVSAALIGITTVCFIFFGAFGTQSAMAHCDTMEGPVIKAAKQALETGNANLILIWVQEKDEAEIKAAFEQTLAARKNGGAAKDVADRWFFETLVRIHRAGEGAPYTGLKSESPEPIVLASDKAIETGSADELIKHVTTEIREGIAKRFKEVLEKKNFDKNNVKAGREFVKAYVEYVHYVEGIYAAAMKSGHEHGHALEEGKSEGKNK